jgi:hypothetical protein
MQSKTEAAAAAAAASKFTKLVQCQQKMRKEKQNKKIIKNFIKTQFSKHLFHSSPSAPGGTYCQMLHMNRKFNFAQFHFFCTQNIFLLLPRNKTKIK